MLHMRRFVQGTDEPVWVEVLNGAYKDVEEWRPITVDEFLLEQKRPNFDFDGRFIAEMEGRPAGVVHANVDRLRTDGRGFIRFGVIPELRGRGFEQQLIETGMKELKARGMTAAQAWTESTREDHIRLFEGSGFGRVRVFSLMEIDLDRVLHNIGENRQVMIRPLRLDVEDDIQLYDWLGNESFKEHFNFRQHTLEETRAHLLNNPYFKEREFFFAMLNREAAGYIGIGIDEKYNLEKNARTGEVMVIGVLKPYRREGVGTRLMLHALGRLRAMGMTRAILGVDDYNVTEAMKLYEKVGFRVKRKDFIFEREL
jgi:mycothiol synthase